MENQRLLLFAALAFVLFLLWQNWMEFQAKKHPPLAPPVATAPAGGSANSATSIPSASKPGADVPIAAPGIAPGTQPLSGGKRVHVVTDVFEAEIDTQGGDLRRVGLRTYPESVQQHRCHRG